MSPVPLRVSIDAPPVWAPPLGDLVRAAGHEPKDIAEDFDLRLVVSPREGVTEFVAGLDLKPRDHVLFVCPGLSLRNGQTVSEVVLEQSGCLRIGVIAGPLRPAALARGALSAAVLASRFDSVLHIGGQALHSPRFRVYPTSDLRGAELSTALVEALTFGVGLVDGLELGPALRAIFITRCVAQASHAAAALGAEPSTFTGLCGLGDLLVSTAGQQSDAWRFGYDLAKSGSKTSAPNERLQHADLNPLRSSVQHLIARIGPDADQVFSLLTSLQALLSGERDLNASLTQLMERPIREE